MAQSFVARTPPTIEMPSVSAVSRAERVNTAKSSAPGDRGTSTHLYESTASIIDGQTRKGKKFTT